MIVGVIPAAGHATRLGPMSGSKEMLEVRGRPVMEHLLERLLAGGAEEVRVVTRPEKLDLIAHAHARGLRVVPGHPADVAASLLLGLEGLAPDTVALFGFPDTLWEPVDGFRPLVEQVRDGADVALGLFATPDLERSDVVLLDPDGRVAGIEVKPPQPRGTLIWGCAAARAAILSGLREGTEPGVYFDSLVGRRDIRGVRLADQWLDIGTPEALASVMRAQPQPPAARP